MTELTPQELAHRGSQFFRQRKFGAAARCFSRAIEAEPHAASNYCNLSACKLELGDHAEAARLAGRALELDPRMAAAHANRADAQRLAGKLEDAVRDYRAALQREPGNPVVLNKAGACLQLLERHDAARKHFEAALRIAPGFGLARLNLGLLDIVAGRPGPALEHVHAAMKSGNLDPESATVAKTAIQELGEHQRIQPSLDAALEARAPSLLLDTLGKTPARLLKPHAPTVQWLDDVAASCRRLPAEANDLGYEADTTHLLYLEACAHARFESDADTMAHTLQKIQGGRAELEGATGRKVQPLYAACRERQASEAATDSVTEFEAWIRYWHATLVQGHSEAYPGQFKLVPNVLGVRDLLNSSPPGTVAGTVRHLASDIWTGIPPGVPRAVFLLLAIIEIHPFQDGNGRTGRFLMNRELEQCGLGPIPVFPSERKPYIGALINARQKRDAGIMFENLVAMRRTTDQRLTELNHAVARL
ncbi:MAG: tetratricopeptide repeat protein [Xanthomonadales bacterium]|nr:tetratricopeptide repeat protein [Xanthomonadales bacterium]